MCRECKQRKWQKDDHTIAAACRRTGLKDLYNHGNGAWESVESRADLESRQRAWARIGIDQGPGSWMAAWSWTPNDLGSFTDEEIIAMPGLGSLTLEKIRQLPDSSQVEWEKTYSLVYARELEWAKEAFARRDKPKAKKLRQTGAD